MAHGTENSYLFFGGGTLAQFFCMVFLEVTLDRLNYLETHRDDARGMKLPLTGSVKPAFVRLWDRGGTTL